MTKQEFGKMLKEILGEANDKTDIEWCYFGRHMRILLDSITPQAEDRSATSDLATDNTVIRTISEVNKRLSNEVDSLKKELEKWKKGARRIARIYSKTLYLEARMIPYGGFKSFDAEVSRIIEIPEKELFEGDWPQKEVEE